MPNKKARKQNRCIKTSPQNTIYYIVDTCFLKYRYINPSNITSDTERERCQKAKEYWKRIDQHLLSNNARVFILDVCVAETFKCLTQGSYSRTSPAKNYFPTHQARTYALGKFREEIGKGSKVAKSSKRKITFHDIPTTRDLVIGIDRFFENVFKKKFSAGVIDLLILSMARYLIDYMGLPKKSIHIITMDKKLYNLANCYHEMPNAFNPDLIKDNAEKVFNS